MMNLRALSERLQSARTGCLKIYERDGTVLSKTYPEVYADVCSLKRELASCGLQSRDVVGLIGINCYEWVLADLALLALDCVCVALPTELLNEMSLDAIGEKYQLAALLCARVPFDIGGAPGWVCEIKRPLSLQKRSILAPARVRDEDIFSVVISSGTSGKKKGLLMKRTGVENTINVSAQQWQVTTRDCVLLVMPFSNFQQRWLLYMAMWYQFDAAIVPLQRLFQDLHRILPTLVLGPPSFFEWLENRISAERLPGSALLWVSRFAGATLPDSIRWRVQKRLCAKWASTFGNRIRLLLVGSAPTRASTLRAFHAVGLPLYEVYGLTEFGWITFNLPSRHRVGTVGAVVPGVEAAITEEGELLVRSPHPQSAGYVFDGTEEESLTFLHDGAIATGDLVQQDQAGFMRLVGRKKNVIFARGGIKFSPEEIEGDIEQRCPVEKVALISAGAHSELRCVIWSKEWQSQEKQSAVRSALTAVLSKRACSTAAHVLFRPLEELSEANGLLTRNLKLDRRAVVQRYFSQMERSAI